MTLPANLPALLRAEGLTVVEIPGWRTRGHAGAFRPIGVLQHHTGDDDNGLAYARWLATKGRSDLPAPLCQLSTDRQGVLYVCAAGRAYHAGKTKKSGPIPAGDGNTLTAGIEHQLTGSEKISAAQYRTAVITTAVLLRIFGNGAAYTRAHYETSVTGKWDPGDPDGIEFKGKRVLDMDRFRSDVAAYLAHGTNPGKPIGTTPTEEDDMTPEQDQKLSTIDRRVLELQRAHDTAEAAAKARDIAANEKEWARFKVIVDAFAKSSELADFALRHVTDADARAELERMRAEILDVLGRAG